MLLIVMFVKNSTELPFWECAVTMRGFIKSRCGTSYPVEILEKDHRKNENFESPII